ncbi:hypothetical protein N9272_00210 [bacterium]|nr:hypothetical protein [bacterium]
MNERRNDEATVLGQHSKMNFCMSLFLTLLTKCKLGFREKQNFGIYAIE